MDFCHRDSWFKKYELPLMGDKPRHSRYQTMRAALGLFLQRQGSLIVETGCQRGEDDWGAGCSTQVFADFVDRYNCQLISIDNNPENLALAARIANTPRAAFIESDSVAGLAQLRQPIDLLYLDSFDYPYGKILEFYGGKEDLTAAVEAAYAKTDQEIINQFFETIAACQDHCLKELQAALPRLHEKSIVLIDDSGLPGGGKGRVAQKWLADNGWEVILDMYQALWIKAH